MDFETLFAKTPATLEEIRRRVAYALARHPLCRNVSFLGSAARLPHTDGAFRRELVVDASQLHALPASLDLRRAALAAALANRGRFLFRRRQLDDAKAVQTRALSVWQDLGDDGGTLDALNSLGQIGLASRELPEAAEYFTQAAAMAGAIGDARMEGITHANLAGAQIEAGDTALALRTLAPLPQHFAGLRDPVEQGNALLLLGRARRLAGNLAAAEFGGGGVGDGGARIRWIGSGHARLIGTQERVALPVLGAVLLDRHPPAQGGVDALVAGVEDRPAWKVETEE